MVVSYDLILRGDKVYGDFFGVPNSSPLKVTGDEQTAVSLATSSSVGAFE